MDWTQYLIHAKHALYCLSYTLLPKPEFLILAILLSSSRSCVCSFSVLLSLKISCSLQIFSGLSFISLNRVSLILSYGSNNSGILKPLQVLVCVQSQKQKPLRCWGREGVSEVFDSRGARRIQGGGLAAAAVVSCLCSSPLPCNFPPVLPFGVT